jgi:hypothetical protein
LARDSQFNRPEDLAFLQENLPQADQVSLAGGHDLPLEIPGGLARIIHAALASEGSVSVTLSEPLHDSNSSDGCTVGNPLGLLSYGFSRVVKAALTLISRYYNPTDTKVEADWQVVSATS